jgi:hypothetical protein
MADSCPNYPNVPSRMPSACLPVFGSLALFDRPSVGDRLNYESSESRGKCEVAPKSEQQTVILDQK